ncbi:SDR family NAD(P)-dependent oxidoreductase [Treponema sp.]|uniref:SDR family NAD(P)-dependent oxidoreductase n=1 Tax=Treponema sp. TaxID=166 RepID=UPI0025F757CC|nr:SDR family oxidoreductase [Treponema sp.]MCR5219038.1 SDR family oxidoreductase [Treponema sp.]
MSDYSAVKDKCAFVAGASKGTGLELTKALLKNGARVFAAGRHHSPELMELEKEYPGLSFIEADFAESSPSILLKKAEIKKALEETDILAVTFGPFIQKPLEETTAEDWTMLALNDLALPGALVSQVLPHMKKSGFGRIILFGGTRTDSIHPYKSTAAYSACKTAISVLVKSAALIAPEIITCSAILPGFTNHAPQNTREVTPAFLADQAMHLISCPELNGVLLNADRGWCPF